MPEPRTFSPSFETVAAAADVALRREDGIEVQFLTREHGSMENCAHLARGFQKSFTSLRARARRLNEKSLGEIKRVEGVEYRPRDSEARGVYDKLVCQRYILNEGAGWAVRLAPAAVFLHQLHIIDIATGEQILEAGKLDAEKDILIHKLYHAPHTFTAEEYDRAEELMPGFWTDAATGKLRMERPGGPKSNDVADVPEDEMFGEGRKG